MNSSAGKKFAFAVVLLIAAAVLAAVTLYGQVKLVGLQALSAQQELLEMNLRSWDTWEQIGIVLGPIPLMAMFAWREWPRTLKVFFWAVVPV